MFMFICRKPTPRTHEGKHMHANTSALTAHANPHAFMHMLT